MLFIKCVKPAYFDVDDTLIKWRPTENEKEDGVPIEWVSHTLELDEEGRLTTVERRREDTIIPHRVHIEQLKEHKRRGHTIIVWSAGGCDWAAAAVKMLQLEDYVDVVIEKPSSVYDDKQASEFMPKAQWLEDKKENLLEEDYSMKKAESPRAISEDSGETVGNNSWATSTSRNITRPRR